MHDDMFKILEFIIKLKTLTTHTKRTINKLRLQKYYKIIKNSFGRATVLGYIRGTYSKRIYCKKEFYNYF
jgi:hypothetical protein